MRRYLQDTISTFKLELSFDRIGSAAFSSHSHAPPFRRHGNNHHLFYPATSHAARVRQSSAKRDRSQLQTSLLSLSLSLSSLVNSSEKSGSLVVRPLEHSNALPLSPPSSGSDLSNRQSTALCPDMSFDNVSYRTVHWSLTNFIKKIQQKFC